MARSVLVLAVLALLLVSAPAVRADSHAAGEETSQPTPAPALVPAPELAPAPERTVAPPSTHAASESWQYETGYLFALTRGLPEAGVEGGWRYAAMVLTVPLDIVILPFAALAGLFG